MISRVANSCFWLSRYLERVEVLARLLDVNMAFQLDVDLPDAERWRPLVIVTGQEAHYLRTTEPHRHDDAETAQHYLTWHDENPSSIASSLSSARENARTIRETISLEMWETLNDLWLWLSGRGARRQYQEDRPAFYRHLKTQCLLFHGAAEATMLHEEPFRFMRLGTCLERAGQTARLLDVKHHSMGPGDDEIESPSEAAQWLATLRYCSGVEPFFKRELEIFSGRAVANFLLLDGAFPRSVRSNVVRAKNLLALIRVPDSEIGSRATAKLSTMLDKLNMLAADHRQPVDLHELFTWLVNATSEVCQLVHEEFFDPTTGTPGTSQEQTQRH